MSIDLAIANTVFTPSSPIQTKTIFRGRVSQVRRVLEAVSQAGLHPVIFGQRGVGKTSLANVLREFLPDAVAIKITCDTADTFESIWNKVLRQATVTFKQRAFGFSRAEADSHVSLADFLPRKEEISPSDVADVLSQITTKAIVVLDEFDRVVDLVAKRYMADLIKNVSDNNPHVSLVLVGVGKNIGDLIAEHESIGRNLRQIEMPSMSDQELKQILEEGFQTVGLSAAADKYAELISLCDGFPHYAHLLGLAACRTAAAEATTQLTDSVLDKTCASAVDDAIETLREAFHTATATSAASNYPKILVACGLAECDERGVFRATDVVNAANGHLACEFTVQSVVPALAAFASPERGSILESIPVLGRNHYRLRNAMMRPYLRLRARQLRTA